MKKTLLILSVFVAIALAFQPMGIAAVAFQEDGTYEGEATTINLSTGMDGSLSGSTYTITGGAIGSDGNFTGDGTTTTLDAAPTKFIMTHSSGTTYSTIGDFDQINLENDAAIDNAANGTVTVVEGGDTLSLIFDGDDLTIGQSDGSIELYPEASAGDGTVDILTGGDTNDFMYFKTTSNVPIIATSGGCNLQITADGGTVDFDDEALTTTGSATAGSVIVGDDTIDVVVDDQMRFASNDEESTIEAYGFEAKDGVLQLTADEGDDAGDKIQFVSDASTNSLFFTSDTAVKDTHATILTLAKTGALTTTGDVVVVNDSGTTNAVQDVLTLTSSSTGTAAAGLGVGIDFQVEDEGAAAEQQGSIDVVMVDSTDSSEDADFVVSQNSAGTVRETLRIVANHAATTSDYLQFTGNTSETNDLHNVMVLTSATGTAIDNYGISISFQPEDATGADEVASIDILETTAARATNDTDFVFSQNVNGTISERVRFDADGNNILLSGATPGMTIGDAGAEDTNITFDGVAQDYYIGLDDTGGVNEDMFTIGLGATVGAALSPIISANPLRQMYIASIAHLYDTHAAQRPASGTQMGAIVAMVNSDTPDHCGLTGGGANFVVCISNGTDWISLLPDLDLTTAN